MKKIYLLFFVLIVSFKANCQLTLGIGYAGTHPLADLESNKYKNGGGVDIYILSKAFPQYSRIQVQLGADFNVFGAGQRKFPNIQTSNGYTADYYVNNYHNAFSFKARFLTQENTLRYHIDIDLGNRSFYSTQAFAFSQTTTNQPPNSSNFIIQKKAFFPGITAGVLFRLNDKFSLDAYSRIDFGQKAVWLDLNAIKDQDIQNNPINFQYKATNTPLLWLGISAVIQFNLPKFNRNRIPVEQTPQQDEVPTYPLPEPPAEPAPRGRVAR